MSNEEIRALIQWINQYGLKKINEKGKDIILEALERRLSKIPTHDGLRHTCPSCHAPLPNGTHNNCMFCGQPIDWIGFWDSEEESR